MSVWEFRQRNVNRNLYRFLAAQEKAEHSKAQTFLCPVCGGMARWERKPGTGRLVCGCPDCGMYLRG